MLLVGETKTYTYVTAVRRMNRTPRTILYWRQWGMPMGWAIIDGQRTRVVEEEVLLAHGRLHMKNDPAHQDRLRAKRRAAAAQAETPATPA